MRLLSLLCLFLFAGAPALFANNIQITNVQVSDELVPNNANGGYLLTITFDLSWENSWRLATGPENLDGGYVFAYYRQDGGDWTFMGNTLATNNPNFNVTGFSENGSLYYRRASNSGSGDAIASNLTYRGQIDDPNIDLNAAIEVRMFAVEMVWIPEGDFQIGDGGNLPNEFYRPTASGGREPYRILSENSLTVGAGSGLNISQDNVGSGVNSGTIPADYPKGHDGFWMMKYEVSQQQYVDFFNTLTDEQKIPLDPTGPNGKNTDAVVDRNGCTWTGSGDMATTLPTVAMNYVSPTMIYAYLDWAGIRPMTELEYTKAARGTLSVVSGEFAWGTADIYGNGYTAVNVGTANEGVSNISITEGNAQYAETDDVGGPLRVGAIAASVATPGREQAGAGYYGVMDLSGNLTEICISAGATAARSFTDRRGDYVLDYTPAGGFTWPTSWPSSTSGSSLSFRGGAYRDGPDRLRVADRFFGASSFSQGRRDLGFRGAVRAGYTSVN